MKIKNIPANVVVFGFVSFLTDFSSDMIYPLLPVFLTQYLGATQMFIGFVEGIAESTAAFFTLFSGVLADKSKDRSKLVLCGYTLSSFSRPLIALAQTPWLVLFVRFFDRVGKGVRTAPRDALIADSVDAAHHGKAYGFHRSMDHAGAVMGPLAASVLLATIVTDLRVLFWIAAIPGILSVFLIVWKVREVIPDQQKQSAARVYTLKPPTGRLRLYLLILFIFILSCSSDAFLLLRAVELGVPPVWIPVLWMSFNAVKSLTTLPFGALSDKVGRRRIIFLGWLMYAAVYLGFGLASKPEQVWMLFIFYAFFYGMTEGSERALIVELSPANEKGKMFGWYYLVVGLGSLPASLIFGTVWHAFGSKTAFLFSCAISVSATCLLLLFMMIYKSKPLSKQASGALGSI